MSTDFSSIDRLIEFGMGMSLAQQMIHMMNSAMNNMQVAGVNAGTTGQMARPSMPYKAVQWYAVVNGLQAGPLNEAEVTKLIQKSDIGENTLMWTPGMSGWQMACNIPEINKLMLLNK